MRARDHDANRGLPWTAVAALVVVISVAWQGCLQVPFFFDDQAAITHNTSIRSLARLDRVLLPPADGSGMAGRPVVNLSLALNHAIGGLDPRGYHGVNVVLHSLAALTLAGLVRQTLRRPRLRPRYGVAAIPLGLGVALLWALHPLQTESVACVIQRTEIIVSLFYLFTLYAFGRAVDAPESRGWPAVAIGACALGMASKEVMVSAPLVVLLYDRTFVSGTFAAAWRRHRRLHLGLAATWIILGVLLWHMGGSRGAAAGFGLGVSPWSYALRQTEALTANLALAVWPHPLVIDYGTAVVTEVARVWPQGLLVVALVVGSFLAMYRRPALGFAGIAALAVLAPSSSIVPLVAQTAAEHRMYLPLAAVVSLAVIGLWNVLASRAWPVVAIAAVALGAATHARNRTLQDEVSLWSATVAQVPDNPRAHASLGLALADRGRARESIPHYQRALELDPTSVATEQNLGNAYYALRDWPAALAHFRRVVSLDPKFASGHNNLGATLGELGDTDGAIASYRTALSLDPQHVGAAQNLGRLLLTLGRFSAAVPVYEHWVAAQPDSADAHYHLGLALGRAGRLDESKPHFLEALRLKPSAASYVNYARFLAEAGLTDDAIAALEQALRLRPDFAEARAALDRLKGPR